MLFLLVVFFDFFLHTLYIHILKEQDDFPSEQAEHHAKGNEYPGHYLSYHRRSRRVDISVDWYGKTKPKQCAKVQYSYNVIGFSHLIIHPFILLQKQLYITIS
jgi:hypothetical protein